MGRPLLSPPPPHVLWSSLEVARDNINVHVYSNVMIYTYIKAQSVVVYRTLIVIICLEINANNSRESRFYLSSLGHKIKVHIPRSTWSAKKCPLYPTP